LTISTSSPLRPRPSSLAVVWPFSSHTCGRARRHAHVHTDAHAHAHVCMRMRLLR
jgi:hypothetical protein